MIRFVAFGFVATAGVVNADDFNTVVGKAPPQANSPLPLTSAPKITIHDYVNDSISEAQSSQQVATLGPVITIQDYINAAAEDSNAG